MHNTSEKLLPFLEHLAELRSRLLKVLLGLLISVGVTYTFASDIFNLLTKPLQEGFKDVELIGTGPAEAFMCKLTVSIAAGIVLSIPWIFFQFWQFVAPGLLPKEKRYALPFVAVASFFFLLGLAFCYKVVLPFGFEFFSAEFASVEMKPTIRVGEYLAFISRLCLVFGLIFELPILSYFLAQIGVLTHGWLLAKFRYFIVGIFIVAGVLTPPDVVTQLLLAGPLLVIYLLCIGIVFAVNRGRSMPAEGSHPDSPNLPQQL